MLVATRIRRKMSEGGGIRKIHAVVSSGMSLRLQDVYPNILSTLHENGKAAQNERLGFFGKKKPSAGEIVKACSGKIYMRSAT